MLARARGFRNFQHLRACRAAGARLETVAEPAMIDHALVERTLRQFGGAVQLAQWPSRRKARAI